MAAVREVIGGVSVGMRFPDLAAVPACAPYDELAEAVDRMQPGTEKLPVVLVGERADELPDHALPGHRLVRTAHGRLAGAFGAAASPVGGSHERLVPRDQDLDAARAEVHRLARADAVRAGADPRRVHTGLEPEIPVPYLPGAVLLRARAVGPPMPL
jgi:hypothetical protein